MDIVDFAERQLGDKLLGYQKKMLSELASEGTCYYFCGRLPGKSILERVINQYMEETNNFEPCGYEDSLMGIN